MTCSRGYCLDYSKKLLFVPLVLLLIFTCMILFDLDKLNCRQL